MFIVFTDRPSDSPFIERVFRYTSERAGTFLSMATSQWMMVVTRVEGRLTLTVRGPETKATPADCPAEGEWFGILFKTGTFMPKFPALSLMDRQDLTLPDATSRSFWLNGAAWEYPTFENAEPFVNRLLREGLIVQDATVTSALLGPLNGLSARSAQRHFLRATGLTHGTIYQIERARLAMNLLKEGFSILDTVQAAGYYDQAHLTRSLGRFAGQTPTQIIRGSQQLSLLYKTGLFGAITMTPSASENEGIGVQAVSVRRF